MPSIADFIQESQETVLTLVYNIESHDAIPYNQNFEARTNPTEYKLLSKSAVQQI